MGAGSQNTDSPLGKKSPTWIIIYPWVVIFFSSLFLFYKYILSVSPSIMTNELMKYFHLTGAGFGNLGATFVYASFVTQLFVGPLLDRYSPRILTAAAIAISGLGAIYFAQSQTLFSAEVSRAIVGAGAAFATVSYMKFASIWFKPRHLALVGGFLATAAMMGSFFGEGPTAELIKHIGWQTSLIYFGWAGFVLAFLFFLVVRDKNPYFEHANTNIPVKLTWKSIFSVLGRLPNWYLMLYSGLAFAPLAVFGGLWGNAFARQAYHLDNSQAAFLTSFMFLGLAVGAPVLGFISDRLGKRYEVMLPALLLTIVSLLIVIYANFLPIPIIRFSLFMVGFGTGGFMLAFTAGRELNSVLLAATVVGLINSGDDLFVAITEPSIGKMLDVFSKGKMVDGMAYFSVTNYHLAFILLPIYLLGALFFLKLLKKHLQGIR
jgi:nitrate/nitrite transporter NarK